MTIYHSSADVQGGMLWTITGSATVYGPEEITAVLSANGAPTAPTIWYLEGPSGNDETALVSSAAGTAKFMPQFTATEPAPYGTWQLQALDASANVLATCVVQMLMRQRESFASDPFNYIIT